MRYWQHGDTGSCCASEEQPSKRWYEISEIQYDINEGAKNTEQLLQPDNGYVCNRPGSCAKGQGGKCYSGFDCPDKAIAC